MKLTIFQLNSHRFIGAFHKETKRNGQQARFDGGSCVAEGGCRRTQVWSLTGRASCWVDKLHASDRFKLIEVKSQVDIEQCGGQERGARIGFGDAVGFAEAEKSTSRDRHVAGCIFPGSLPTATLVLSTTPLTFFGIKQQLVVSHTLTGFHHPMLTPGLKLKYSWGIVKYWLVSI